MGEEILIGYLEEVVETNQNWDIPIPTTGGIIGSPEE